MRGEFAGAGEGAQPADLGGDGEDGEGGGGFYVGDDEAEGGVHCDADVYLGA